MNNYQLTPNTTWEQFSKNTEVVESIYSLFMPLVNDGSWNYMNFTSESAIFEDEGGNWVSLGLLVQAEESQIEKLDSLNVSIKESENKGFLETTMLDLAVKYELDKS